MAVALLGHGAQAERAALASTPEPPDRLAVDTMTDSGRSASISPLSAARSSFWPLPATPATPKISPARTAERHVVQRDAELVGLAQRSGRCDDELRLAEGAPRGLARSP